MTTGPQPSGPGAGFHASSRSPRATARSERRRRNVFASLLGLLPLLAGCFDAPDLPIQDPTAGERVDSIARPASGGKAAPPPAPVARGRGPSDTLPVAATAEPAAGYLPVPEVPDELAVDPRLLAVHGYDAVPALDRRADIEQLLAIVVIVENLNVRRVRSGQGPQHLSLATLAAIGQGARAADLAALFGRDGAASNPAPVVRRPSTEAKWERLAHRTRPVYWPARDGQLAPTPSEPVGERQVAIVIKRPEARSLSDPPLPVLKDGRAVETAQPDVPSLPAESGYGRPPGDEVCPPLTFSGCLHMQTLSLASAFVTGLGSPGGLRNIPNGAVSLAP